MKRTSSTMLWPRFNFDKRKCVDWTVKRSERRCRVVWIWLINWPRSDNSSLWLTLMLKTCGALLICFISFPSSSPGWVAECGESISGRRSAAIVRPKFWTSSGDLKNWLLGCLWADRMKSHTNRFVIISAFDWWKFRRCSCFSLSARGL